MKRILQKFEKERIKEEVLEKVKVKDERKFYLVCEKCEIAFFENDDILKVSTGGYRCPLVIRTFFGNNVCLNKIYAGYSQEEFGKYYKINPK